MDARARTHAPMGLLAEMLAGLRGAPAGLETPDGDPVPDLSLDRIETSEDGATVSTVLGRPSGDRFEVTVRWLGDESP